MNTVGLIALIACMASVCAKMIFTLRIRGLKRVREQENGTYQDAQKALHQALQNNKRVEAETKHLETRRRSMDRNLKMVSNTLDELLKRKEEDDTIRAFQKALIKGGKP